MLGVDPGTVCTGWSLFNNGDLINCNKIHLTSGWLQSKRLQYMMWGIETVMTAYSPDVLAIEDQFVGANQRTSLVTARAKGIVIAMASAYNIKVVEYAPSEIKKAVTGLGNASKELLQQKIIELYGNHEIVKALGDFCDKGKNKNDDIFDSIGIGHTYHILGEEKVVSVRDKKTKKLVAKTVSRII